MRLIVAIVLVFSVCATASAAGPSGGEETIRLSVRSEFSRSHVYETDGNEIRTLSYEYIEGRGWVGEDGSCYTRTEDGWTYSPPGASRV
ncbi:MAG: hypothetical protein GF408_03735 [Candidatus Omnitrophica bacterium]|nr:hypothetical protein [Candidatus Omnitrophota bacterium]